MCILSGVLLPGLAGCANLAPDYVRPAAPVPDQWVLTETMGETSPLPAWEDYFADPQLRQLISLALDNSRDLRLAVLRVEEARAAFAIQRAEQLPGVSAQAGGTRSRTPADLSSTGRALVGSQFQAGLGVAAWELDFWGRIASLKDAALESFLASDANRRAATLSLVAQVAQAYLGLRETEERLELTRRTIATRAVSYRIFSRRVEEGATARLDLTQVESLLRQAESLGAQLEQTRAAQFHALELLIGASLPAGWQAGGGATVLADLAPGLPSNLLNRRPDIIAAEHQLKAANANIGAARAAFFPAISLTGSLNTASADLDGLLAGGSHAWNFGPNLSLPIFDGGRNSASLDLAEVRRDQRVAEYERTIQAAFRDVADALSAIRWLGEQARLAEATQAVQAERARLAKLRYDNGAAAFLEVLDAQRELLTADLQLVQVRRQLLAARVDLYSALGGGAAQLPAADAPTSDFMP